MQKCEELIHTVIK